MAHRKGRVEGLKVIQGPELVEIQRLWMWVVHPQS